MTTAVAPVGSTPPSGTVIVWSSSVARAGLAVDRDLARGPGRPSGPMTVLRRTRSTPAAGVGCCAVIVTGPRSAARRTRERAPDVVGRAHRIGAAVRRIPGTIAAAAVARRPRAPARRRPAERPRGASAVRRADREPRPIAAHDEHGRRPRRARRRLDVRTWRRCLPRGAPILPPWTTRRRQHPAAPARSAATGPGLLRAIEARLPDVRLLTDVPTASRTGATRPPTSAAGLPLAVALPEPRPTGRRARPAVRRVRRPDRPAWRGHRPVGRRGRHRGRADDRVHAHGPGARDRPRQPHGHDPARDHQRDAQGRGRRARPVLRPRPGVVRDVHDRRQPRAPTPAGCAA